MRLKRIYHKDPETGLWHFVIQNGKTRTVSVDGFRTRKEAELNAGHILDGVKSYKNNVNNQS
jgi:hypothetical protein